MVSSGKSTLNPDEPKFFSYIVFKSLCCFGTIVRALEEERPLHDTHKRLSRNLADVRDGSERTIDTGYWLCDVVGCEVGSNEITLLAQEL